MAEAITSIASLLWPLLVLLGLLLFRRPLLEVVQSAKQREWTLEVGGQTLSMKQLSDQQNSMIEDLQAKVSVLNDAVNALTAAQVGGSDAISGRDLSEDSEGVEGIGTVSNSVLWVDDVPENNALLVDQLQRNGVRVDLARTTRDALDKLSQRRYGALVSDMGRVEDGVQIPDAGMRLLLATRKDYPALPFLIYSGENSKAKYRQIALSEGATEVTASPAVLSGQLRSIGLL